MAKLNISNVIKSEEEILEFAVDCEPFQAAEFTVTQIHVEGEIVNNAGRIEIGATLYATATAPCSRCMEDAKLPLTVDIQEKLTNNIDNPDAMCYNNGRVDVNEIAREVLSLELPMVVHCDKCAERVN